MKNGNGYQNLLILWTRIFAREIVLTLNHAFVNNNTCIETGLFASKDVKIKPVFSDCF